MLGLFHVTLTLQWGHSMEIDFANIALNNLTGLYDATIGASKAKKTRKRQIRNEYTTQEHNIRKEVSSFLDESDFRSLAGGGKVGTLSPSIKKLTDQALQDLYVKKQREINAL